MIKKILIANRGEIAVRIIRAARELGIDTVAVYSTADKNSLHVQIAGEAVCIGGPKSSDSYLNISAIIEAAKMTGAEAIHPGFGFLSENSDFPRKCRENNIIFIGPSAEVIEKMGNKLAARKLMKESGIPIVPGGQDNVTTADEAVKLAETIGYPVLIKAASGGGGKGMRKAYSEGEIREAYNIAKQEAISSFGDDVMYIEKLIEDPKHIEFQILADEKGNVVHLGERDCSIQRRNQKILEEAPSAGISQELREAMGMVAIKAAKAVEYVSAGTIEFVLDKNHNFYFIEMNTRIQVEHPVTEMLTGIDIVAWQIKIASGIPLSFCQDEVSFTGHAIECRITAEDIDNDFAPNAGTVDFVHFALGAGVRVDSYLYNGCQVSPYYDSMMAKIIVHGKTRSDAIRKMRRALEETVITGVKNNLILQNLLMYESDFIRGNYHTGYINTHLKKLLDLNKAAGGNMR